MFTPIKIYCHVVISKLRLMAAILCLGLISVPPVLADFYEIPVFTSGFPDEAFCWEQQVIFNPNNPGQVSNVNYFQRQIVYDNLDLLPSHLERNPSQLNHSATPGLQYFILSGDGLIGEGFWRDNALQNNPYWLPVSVFVERSYVFDFDITSRISSQPLPFNSPIFGSASILNSSGKPTSICVFATDPVWSGSQIESNQITSVNRFFDSIRNDSFFRGFDATNFRYVDVSDVGPQDVSAPNTTNHNYTIFVYDDSDGDGVPDYVEVEEGTSATEGTSFLDTDFDGFADYIEKISSSDHLDPQSIPADSDGDGVPDFVEEDQGTDPFDETSFTDSDGDGVSNYEEAKSGTGGNSIGSAVGIFDYEIDIPLPPELPGILSAVINGVTVPFTSISVGVEPVINFIWDLIGWFFEALFSLIPFLGEIPGWLAPAPGTILSYPDSVAGVSLPGDDYVVQYRWSDESDLGKLLSLLVRVSAIFWLLSFFFRSVIPSKEH